MLGELEGRGGLAGVLPEGGGHRLLVRALRRRRGHCPARLADRALAIPRPGRHVRVPPRILDGADGADEGEVLLPLLHRVALEVLETGVER